MVTISTDFLTLISSLFCDIKLFVPIKYSAAGLGFQKEKAKLSNKRFEKVVKPPKILNTTIITIKIADTCLVVSELEDRKFGKRRMERGGPRLPPVKVGERYKVRIEALGKGGDGIARIKGFVIFVPNTKVGDEVEIVINSVKQKFAFGEIIG